VRSRTLSVLERRLENENFKRSLEISKENELQIKRGKNVHSSIVQARDAKILSIFQKQD